MKIILVYQDLAWAISCLLQFT